MFDLKVSSWDCTYQIPTGRIIRTIASYDIEDRTIIFGNWNASEPTLRPVEDDAIRQSNPEQAMLAPLFHEIVHDVLRVIGEESRYDSLFYFEMLEDELGLPQWKPCVYCGSKMEYPDNSVVCRRCHEEEIGMEYVDVDARRFN